MFCDIFEICEYGSYTLRSYYTMTKKIFSLKIQISLKSAQEFDLFYTNSPIKIKHVSTLGQWMYVLLNDKWFMITKIWKIVFEIKSKRMM